MHTHTHTFNGLFSTIIWVSRHQKGSTNLDFNEAIDGVAVSCSLLSLDHMQIICTSLQTDNHASISSLNFFTGQTLFLTFNQQCQSTEGKSCRHQLQISPVSTVNILLISIT